MPEHLEPASSQELADMLKKNASGSTHAVVPVGGGTTVSHWSAPISDGLQLNTDKLNRVIDYPARDLTITVEAGISIEELGKVLATENQRLPIDLGSPGQATLGGAIAANASGSRRFGHGSFRDCLIGITAVTASGEEFHAGGRVVKNVAGYDLCKLLIGSEGTLGILCQATLKLSPCPERQVVVSVRMPEIEDYNILMERLITSGTRPVSVDLVTGRILEGLPAREQACGSEHELLIGFEGTADDVDWQCQQLHQEFDPFQPEFARQWQDTAAMELWQRLAEFPLNPGFSHSVSSTVQATVSLLPSRLIDFVLEAASSEVAILAGVGHGRSELLIDCQDAASATATVNGLRRRVEDAGGQLMLQYRPDQWHEAVSFHGRPPAASLQMMKIKHALDPKGILNPGSRLSSFLTLPAGESPC